MHVSYVYARVSYVYARVAELCVAATLAVCLVSLFVSVCRSCVRVVIICLASTHTPIPRWCPRVRAWLFFTFLPNLT